MSNEASATEKETLHRYLRLGRDALLWKLEGLSETEMRMPMTGTGTNLLGLVKHAGCVEYGYLGSSFGRPPPEPMAWDDRDPGANNDMYATAEETAQDIVGFYQRAIEHADTTIETLDLGTEGEVPWWAPERNPVTLHRILVHMIADLHRHCGHADIIRETIDGSVGLRPGLGFMPDRDREWWDSYVAKLRAIAEASEA